MSKKDALNHNLDLLKKIITILITSFLASIAFIFINSSKLSFIANFIAFLGTILLLVAIYFSFKFYIKYNKELEKIE